MLAGGVLVALAVPALQLKIVTTGVDDLPQDLAVIKTYNRVKEVFPTEGVTATVVVKADNVRSGDGRGRHRRAAPPACETPIDVLPGTEVNYSKDGTVAEDRRPDARQRQRRRSPRTRSNEIRNDDHPGDDRAGRRARPSTSAATRPRRRTSGTSSTAGCR